MTTLRNATNEIYSGLRKQVFDLRSNRSEIKYECQVMVNAVMMELALPKTVVTLVAVADGTASLYFSNGGGVIGAGASERVRMVALEFIEAGVRTGDALEQSESYPLPQHGCVRFYVVGRGAVATIERSEEEVKASKDSLSKLYHKGQELIAAIRECDNQCARRQAADG